MDIQVKINDRFAALDEFDNLPAEIKQRFRDMDLDFIPALWKQVEFLNPGMHLDEKMAAYQDAWRRIEFQLLVESFKRKSGSN